MPTGQKRHYGICNDCGESKLLSNTKEKRCSACHNFLKRNGYHRPAVDSSSRETLMQQVTKAQKTIMQLQAELDQAYATIQELNKYRPLGTRKPSP